MAGVSDTTTGRLIAAGQLRPLLRCVFAVGHDAPIEHGDETAALLALGAGAALSHGTAAALWGIGPPRTSDGAVHIVTAVHAANPPGVRVHRTRTLAPADVRIHKGLPVTSPARTLLDQAGTVTSRELELAFDQALITRIMGPAEGWELVGRAAGRPGFGRLRALLERQHGPKLTRSEAEERFLALIRQAGLPEPETNVRIHGFEVDFLWREQGVVVEIDGFRFHSSRRSFEHDRRKDATLQAAGLLTMRVTWIQMQSEAYAVIARLATTLARSG
jgi:very-short-patch-repair endonuclease